MTNQIWFSENINPIFSQEDRDTYRQLVDNQMLPIGNEVNGRNLIRCMTNDEITLLEFLNSKGKEVIVCGALNQDGTDYDSKLYPYNESEFDKYMQPITVVYDGQSIFQYVSDNTSAGWKSFKEHNVIIILSI